jgi:hypothetical protein
MNGRGCQAENQVSHRYRQPIAHPELLAKKAPTAHQETGATGLPATIHDGKTYRHT